MTSARWTASTRARTSPSSQQTTMLYIHPEECIDCGACVPACPVAAIYESIDATPSHQKDLIEANAVYRNGDADTMAQAEAIVRRTSRARRDHGHPGRRAPGRARPVLTAASADRASASPGFAGSDALANAELTPIADADEDRHLERQRHPGAPGAGPGMDRARAPGRRLPAGDQGLVRTRSRPRSARWRATGATGTAARATRASACTSARPSRPSGRRSPIPRSTTRTASSPPTSAA